MQENLLDTIKVGDIIWAKRYKNQEEKTKLKQRHYESPFVIIKKTKKKVYALMCTSNPHNNINWKVLYYQLGRLTYNLDKNCYVSTLNCYKLEETQYLRTMNHLSYYDLNKLRKYINILLNSDFKIKPNINLSSIKFKYEIGDIIEYSNNRYYIYDIDRNYYYVNPMAKHLKLKNRILIGNTYYNFDLCRCDKISKKSEIKLIDTLNYEEINLIDNRKKEQINKDKNININEGSLIEYNDNLYYVYSKDSKLINAYVVYNSSKKLKNMKKIYIGGGTFYTFFQKNYIKIDSVYRLRRKAKNYEMEYIKGAHNKKIYNIKSLREIDNFKPYMIIVNEYNNKNYLILNREDNIIELVNINDYSEHFYFLLEYGKCPYKYHSFISEDEYSKYKDKIAEFKILDKYNVL